jgi:hypothetical protein
MTGIASRKSVLGIEVESTEGTLVIPTGATSYVALQPDFDMTPQFKNLENAELKSSIGMGKPIRGDESPSVNLSHYLRHSGVEGTAPNIAPLLKTLFGGQTTQSTQRTTDSGSTTTAVVLTAGGSDYERGAAVLLKDGVNGYSILPVHSVASETLTLGFAAPGAPAAGVSCGKFCLFKPANEDHQTISVSHYAGNGGMAQYLAGGRVSEGSFEFAAGQLINSKFKIDGIWYGNNAILITSSNKYIDFEDQDGVQVATLPVGWYKDPHELAAAAATALNDASARTATCTYDDADGKFDWTMTGTTFKLLWNTGANTANAAAAKFGDTTAADRTGATTYTSTSAMTFAAPHTPSYDSADPLVAKANQFLIGDQSNYQSLKASKVTLTITDEIKRIEDISAATGVSGSVVMGRKVKVQASGLYEKYDVNKFKRYRSGDDTRAFYAFGSKTGGSWDAGKSGCFYLPTTTVSDFKVKDDGGLLGWDISLEGYVDGSGNGECYLNFL